ncbi:MAG: DUF4270 family protein [Chitinophagaceae bacterium]|nr:DUF4270 family protein [Chitinophagaceae bacterium]
MQKRILPLAITAFILFSVIGFNCTKLDTTDLGSDLLPAVDNVNTFDTILNINSTQGFFNDSSYISKYDDYALGSISNDPLFGLTQASIFMQLKPPFYRFYFGDPGDTIVGLDSIVLCLKYRGFYGDSLIPVHLEVREVNDFQFGIDSVYKENTTAYQPNVMGTILASANIDVRTLGNYVKFTNGRDSVNNQIRIKMPAGWASALFNRDSTVGNTLNNAFYSDSIFRRFYNGIAVIGGGGGNGLIYTNLSDTATKIEIHYRKKTAGKIDSVYSSFRLNPSLSENAANKPVSNTANYIKRTRAGYPVSNPVPGEHYVQTAPGTYVNLHIPGLAGLSNRIIHRAEVIVEQIPTDPVLDEKLAAPNFLYLDLVDSGSVPKWKPVYYDLNTAVLYDPDYKTSIPYWPGDIDYLYFGGYRRSKTDPFGQQIKYYNFNVSRYVQHIVTNRMPVYDMRIYAPFNINYAQHSVTYIPFENNLAFGRVRIGSGSNPNYRLRLRIVYSKI